MVVRPSTLQAFIRHQPITHTHHFRKVYYVSSASPSRRQPEASKEETVMSLLPIEMLFERNISGNPPAISLAGPPPPPPLPAAIVHNPQEPNLGLAKLHCCDTYELARQLEMNAGFTRQQSKILMEIIHHQLRASVSRAEETMLSYSQLDNETHLLRGAIAELRNEVRIMRRNDATLLRSELNSLALEIEAIENRLHEDLVSMQAEIDLEMNDYRAEARQEHKLTQIEVQEINNRLTVLLGECNISLESLKWQMIWKGLMGAVFATMGVSLIGYALSALRWRNESSKVASKPSPTIIDPTLTYADMEL
ncbi:hypothetical protein EC973_003981 [Apophysomyces ossiformis]|uniref:Uncharacterized protein n=1 Tax=Apophysomyces ossiformis TaxID=679940 RepID=A0A8H7BGM4_9FUNG|nr:hypothetical protein EC973_003981 [Apophysomyces ossiformis]